jgi:ferredoxin-NADP reductase
MTSLHLLLWIVGGLLLQLVIYLSYCFWGHWVDYLALRHSADTLGFPDGALKSSDEQEIFAPAWRGLRNFMVVQKQVEDASLSVCSFYLAPQDALPLPLFQPGQFLTFQLDLPLPSGSSTPVIRCYSLSDAPEQKRYRVSIKRAPAPAGSSVPPGRSSNFFHDHIDVGSVLQVRAPSGHFYLEQSDAPVVLIGGGIGITPMLSMLNASLCEQPGREVWLFYGVRNSSDVVMRSHLEGMAAAHSNFQLRLCFSNPLAADVANRDYQHCGRIDVELLRRQLPLKPYHFYICGPTAMLQSLVPGLEDWGVPDARIHYEAFGPASIQRKKPSAPGFALVPAELSDNALNVSFTRSGKQAPWQTTAGTLLEFAEAQGIAVQSGCRAGGCGTCQTTILAGEVSYRQTPDFDPQPGTCLLCVCTPKTPVTLEL